MHLSEELGEEDRRIREGKVDLRGEEVRHGGLEIRTDGGGGVFDLVVKDTDLKLECRTRNSDGRSDRSSRRVSRRDDGDISVRNRDGAGERALVGLGLDVDGFSSLGLDSGQPGVQLALSLRLDQLSAELFRLARLALEFSGHLLETLVSICLILFFIDRVHKDKLLVSVKDREEKRKRFFFSFFFDC